MATVIKPPQKFILSKPSLFCAGSIEMGKAERWADKIEKALVDLDIIILNPRRENWDSTWVQEKTNPQFREQVLWELSGLECADMVAVYFDPNTKSPITLLELGLFGRSNDNNEKFNQMLVCCPQGFYRKGNVDIVCERYGILQVDTLDALIEDVRNYFATMLNQKEIF